MAEDDENDNATLKLLKHVKGIRGDIESPHNFVWSHVTFFEVLFFSFDYSFIVLEPSDA